MSTLGNKLTLCPTCQGKVAVTARECPHCGHPFYDEPPRQRATDERSPREIAITTGFVPGLIPAGSTLTEEALECIIGEGRQTIRRRFIFGELSQGEVVPGVPCVAVGDHIIMRKAALDDWIAANERSQQRGNRGGRRNRHKR